MVKIEPGRSLYFAVFKANSPNKSNHARKGKKVHARNWCFFCVIFSGGHLSPWKNVCVLNINRSANFMKLFITVKLMTVLWPRNCPLHSTHMLGSHQLVPPEMSQKFIAFTWLLEYQGGMERKVMTSYSLPGNSWFCYKIGRDPKK